MVPAVSAALATPPEVAAGEPGASRWAMFRRLRGYLARNRGRYVLGALLLLGYDAGIVVVPLLVGWSIQAVADSLPAAEVGRRAAILALVTSGRMVFRFLSRITIFDAARQIEYELRNDLFAHLERLPQSFYFRWRTGDLMSRCVNDLTSVRLLLGPGLLNVLQTPIMFLSVIAVMFALSAKLALLVLLPYPLFILIARGFGRGMHASNLAVQVGLADLGSQLQETISGISVVKAYAVEETTRKRFEAASEDLYRRKLGLAQVMGAMPAVTSLLPALAMWIVFLVGGWAVEAGRMEIRVFFTFAMYIYELTFPSFLMGWVFALVQRGAASMQRIDEVLATEPSIADRPDRVEVKALRGEIEFRDLSFCYPGSDRKPALEGVNLLVPAGSVLGVVGPVGSGKTTLASLIPRLYEVEDGTLFLDGIDINRLPLATLRSHIAMVPQDSFLFSISLADNIAYGLDSTDPVRVSEAAERAQLVKDLAELPDGYETVVGERGVMLSGGQRQRAALARALCMRPSILILDDTLSSVDAETEAAIQKGLEEVFRERTVVVVASRVSTVRGADHIVVLDDGRIVEQGAHDELIDRGGLYARLAREQERERELEALDSAVGAV
jgi:ATP-binding cassette subfamily B protein